MSQPRNDWDDEERDALDGLEGELAGIRRRHADDPSLAQLRAAAADVLPPDEQARVTRHLQDSAWSRALVDGLRDADAGADDRLDAASEQRLFDRIMREAEPAAPRRAALRPWWRPAMAVGGGLAVAATLLIAVAISRSGSDVTPAPGGALPSPGSDRAPVETRAPAQSAPVQIAFIKPEVRLSASALTWRGDPSANPFLRDIAPAFDAYRASDYARAVTAFDRLATVYPNSIDVRFYQGVSRMLAGDEAGAIAPLEAAARIGNATFADEYRGSWRCRSSERAGRRRAAGSSICVAAGALTRRQRAPPSHRSTHHPRSRRDDDAPPPGPMDGDRGGAGDCRAGSAVRRSAAAGSRRDALADTRPRAGTSPVRACARHGTRERPRGRRRACPAGPRRSRTT